MPPLFELSKMIHNYSRGRFVTGYPLVLAVGAAGQFACKVHGNNTPTTRVEGIGNLEISSLTNSWLDGRFTCCFKQMNAFPQNIVQRIRIANAKGALQYKGIQLPWHCLFDHTSTRLVET